MHALKRKNMSGRAPKEKQKRSENRFSVLQTVDDDDTYSEDNEEEVREYKVVIPPIVVDAVHSFQAVYKLIGPTYQFKRMSVGTKVISPSIAQLDLAKRKLIETGFKFYSHESKDTKLFKLVLYGLPQTDPKEIKEELKSTYNINVINVKEIKTSRSSADDALYMLEFDRTQNSKSQVVKIRQMCSIVVYWRKPQKGNKGPTQCTKCAMYGHGARNCFRKNICIACGGDHDVANCQVNKTPQGSPAAYKCFNCVKKNLKNSNHRADDPRCPSRKEYLTIRENMQNKARSIQNRCVRNLFEEAPEDLPQMPTSANFLPADNSNGSPRISYANTTRESNRQPNTCGDLYSIDELFQIFTGAISDLRKCTTKIEQLNVIMSMLKYAI